MYLIIKYKLFYVQEVLAAGKRASEGYHDGEAMMSAIRARLARKSLPLVSADGLVIYGLQISPTVQVATGILFYILLMNSFYFFINSILKKFANNYNYNYIKYLEKIDYFCL